MAVVNLLLVTMFMTISVANGQEDDIISPDLRDTITDADVDFEYIDDESSK